MKKSSFGIKLFGGVSIYFGCPSLVAFFGGIAWHMSSSRSMTTSDAIVLFKNLVGVLGLISGVGVLSLQNWARLLILVAAGMSVLLTPIMVWVIYPTLFGESPVTLGLTTLVWNGFMIWYFLRPGVKAQFQK
ncbi:MAG: hypothetical protein HY353_04620 [Candidatus Omnitrophica bacterium]|nr:hypothetical protein [Candidatus Omnitrophota bacterium]